MPFFPWIMVAGGLGALLWLFRDDAPATYPRPLNLPLPGAGRLVPVVPLPWRITQKYGGKNNHPGLDLGVPIGTTIFAPAAATIERIDRAGEGKGVYNGNAVVLNTGGLRFAFLHLSGVAVRVGERVRPGQILGWSGNTGQSTGPHLHLQVWNSTGQTIDPLVLFDARAT